jgi:hypothetical protein
LDGVSLFDFPIGVVLADWGSQGYFPMNALGFGLNSSVYRALLSTKQITSRSVSMFWGLQGPNKRSQLDGGFVIGGYDQAKVTGPNYTAPLTKDDDSCDTKMVVTITDLVLNFANGTDASLFNGTRNTVLKACVDPSYPVLMTLPLSYFKVFQNFTGQAENGFNRTFGLPFYSMVYNDTLTNVYVFQPCQTNANDISYAGDLTIKLDSGLSIRVPNDQLIVPDRTISPEGEIIANGSSPNIVINPIKEINANDQLHLGRQFLSAAYVLLNEDSSTFTLWKANPTNHEDFMAVDRNNTPNIAGCSTRVTVTNGSKLSTGSIVGIVVSVLAALLIIALLAYRGSKKNEKVRTLLKQPADYQEQAKTGPVEVPLQNLSSSELDAFSAHPTTELSAEYELHELVELPARTSESDDVKPKS